MKPNKKALGDWGEERAAQYLENLGYRILARKWRVHHLGEMDLIALHPSGKAFVFVEVKTRQARFQGTAHEALTPHKKRRLNALVETYLQRCDQGLPDAVQVDWLNILTFEDGTHRIDHFEALDLST